jgi:tRNA (adenine57-N1/adenine58-N1)-methyltransferase
MNLIKENDTIKIYFENRKSFITKAKNAPYHTHLGMVSMENFIGKEYGYHGITNKGKKFFVVRPTLDDMIMKIKRATQVSYPKDLSYAIFKMGIKAGDKVVEAGCGSGASTTAFAYFVGENGKVVSYEKRQEFIELAHSNLERFNLESRVEFKNRDIAQGFDSEDSDAVAFFLDVKTPWDYMDGIKKLLKTGATLCVLCPTTNQISKTLVSMEKGFIDVNVVEIMMRWYKANPERIRPEDKMIGHTAYLIFGKRINEGVV